MENQFISHCLSGQISPKAIITAPAEIYASLTHPFAPATPKNMPLALLRPSHVDELAQIMRICSANHIAMRFRGNGTSLYPLPIPANKPWVLISSAKLGKIRTPNKGERKISVEAGARWANVSSILHKNNFFLPGLNIHPMASMGGILAENRAPGDFPAQGTCCSRLLSLGVMTANGEKIFLPAQTGHACKLTPEAPLAQIFCGSRGIYGMIFETCLRLQTKPQKTMSLLLQGGGDNLAEILIAFSGLNANALLYLEENCANALRLPKSASYLLQFAGAECETQNQVAECRELAKKFNLKIYDFTQPWPLDIFIATALPGQNKHLWELAGAPERFASMIEAVQNIAKQRGLHVALFGYPEIARLTAIFANATEPAWEKTKKELFNLRLVFGDSPHLEESLDMDEQCWRKKFSSFRNTLSAALDPDALLCHGDDEN